MKTTKDAPDPDIYEHIGYFFALLYLADDDPKNAIWHLQNALIINESGIFEDFLEIDTYLLYAQYPDVQYLVSPYSDQFSDVRNN